MHTEHRTYLAIKAAERDGERWIEGWATTPSVDLVGDVVNPEGAIYGLPLPLLFAHQHDAPIGAVVQANASRAGIRVRARLTAGVAKAEECWNLIRDGALSAVSVGFQVLKASPLPSGGQRFDSWRWLELSVVAVPANPDARVTVGKGFAYSAQQPARHAPVARQQPIPTSFDPELFGEAVADLIRETVAPLRARIKALEESRAEGVMRHAGEFQRALAYRGGDVVRSGEGLYVATRDIEAGKADPQRQGSAWDRLA